MGEVSVPLARDVSEPAELRRFRAILLVTSDSKDPRVLASELRSIRGVHSIEAVVFNKAFKAVDGRAFHFVPDPVPNGALVFVETDNSEHFRAALEAIWAAAQRSTTAIVRMTPMDSW